MLERLFCLAPGELRRLWPFCGLYLLLFAALTLADGLSLALFVQKAGAAKLPASYAVTGLMNLLLIGLYMRFAERLGGRRMFEAILLGSVLVFAITWVAIRWFEGGNVWYMVLFAAREISFTMVLMHFGTYLQDYFTRDEFNRVLPIIYAGGRAGGIAGGWLLERLAVPLGLTNLLLVFAGLGVIGLIVLQIVSRTSLLVDTPEDQAGDAGVRGTDPALEREARSSTAGFLRFVWQSPLLFWTTVTTLLFVGCRWMLNFQYNAFFGSHFPDDASMAQFLGRYTQYALLFSLALQLLIVNRLVRWIGLKGSHLLYGSLLFGGLGLNLLTSTFGTAVFCRLVETELRFGLRNPIAQLMTNKFSKPLRARVRAWTLGALIPMGTLAASLLLARLLDMGWQAAIPWMGAGIGLAYLLASLGLYGSFTENRYTKVTRVAAEEPQLPQSKSATSLRVDGKPESS